ncbi:hypothetical protein BG842_02065 [Haladaptatus sp. W1]|uniref:DUF2298 domain-containing protein n=1 Tax=Haladaptatus sp. W1 TaxID=1897478 RepID=UPI00084997A2|nr:DUF2298 domain-containing protein [Haladaptatus sp. W1]ODR80360.1 hypothetical protein BG842_02065 [Haladaptatus sp. W1]
MEYIPVLIWIGMFTVLSALAVPITSTVFARFPTRGSGFTSTVALGIIGLVAYWVGHVRFGFVALATGLLVLIGVTAYTYRLGAACDWRAFGESMVVFLIAFCFQVAIRAVDPGILFFIEDFLDYGVMRSVLRSSYLPPSDLWFAGARIKYHYGGHLVAALETMMTGIRPSVAYNLALAGFYAMLLAGTYELAGALGAKGGRSRRVAGALGVYFVGFAGNLLAPVVIAIEKIPKPAREIIRKTIASQLHRNAAKPIVSGLSEFEYWDVLQMMPNTLTPFPLFAWLHGELHAHMTSTPFLLLVVAVCYAYYQTPESNRRQRLSFVLLAFPLTAGFSLLTDALSTPSTIGIIWLTLTFSPAAPSTLLPNRVWAWMSATVSPSERWEIADDAKAGWVWTEFRRIAVAIVLTGIVVALIIVIAAPFFLNTVSGAKESIALVSSANRSGLTPLLLIHGVFLAIFVPYLSSALRLDLDGTLSKKGVVGIVGVFLLIDAAIVSHGPALLLFGPLLVATWYLLRTERVHFETLLVLAGLGLVVLVEFFYVANQEYVVSGRGNTLFRAYTHIWILWGISAGVILPRIIKPPDVSWRVVPKRQTLRSLFAVVLILSTSVYGGISVYGHFDRALKPPTEPGQQAEYVYYATQFQDRPNPPTDPPTIDGLLYAEVNYPNETKAIRWLDRNVKGTPTIVTAPGGRWEWRSEASSLTGIPTVAGWAHELVYREWDTYYDRVDDAKTIYYGSPERRVELLSKYDVQYIWVGPDERSRFDIWEFSLLDGVSVAYRNSEVVIYKVDQRELGYSPESIETKMYETKMFQIEPAVASHRDGHIVAAGSNGTLAWWGPLDTIPAGKYVATFNLSVNATGPKPVVKLDVARGATWNGTADFRVLGNASVGDTDGVRTVRIPFVLSQPASDLEFRGTLAEGNGTLRLNKVTLRNKTDGK